MDAACKQTCAKGSKGCADLFVERDADMVGGHEICHGLLSYFFRQTAPDASDGGVAVVTWGRRKATAAKQEKCWSLLLPSNLCCWIPW